MKEPSPYIRQAHDSLEKDFKDLYEKCSLETSPAWGVKMYNMSRRLEAINILIGRPHRLHIRLDQVKSKFGGLRVYYTVVANNSKMCSFLIKMIDRFFPYSFSKFRYWLSCRVVKETDEQIVIRKLMEELADKIINKAEDETYECCECCGKMIGTDHSPRMETSGWISYVCKECYDDIYKSKECIDGQIS